MMNDIDIQKKIWDRSNDARSSGPAETPRVVISCPAGTTVQKDYLNISISSDELGPLSDESTPVALEAYDREESLPDLPPSVAEEPAAPTEEPALPTEEAAAPLAIEAERVSQALVRKEIDTDELVIPPSVVSFKKKTTGSSQERQNTSVLALPPEFASKERAVNDVKQEAEEEKEQENPPAASEGQLSALPSGTLVAERFETIELLESDGQTNLYAVYDRAACPSCGSTENQPDENYCSECGFDFSRGYQLVSCELREALSDDELDGYEGERFVDHQRFYLRQEEDTTFADPPTTQPVQSAPEPQSITLSVGYQSDTGMVRQLNEDSLSVFVLTGLYESLSKPALGLFIVADGMGGHAGGEIASKFVVQSITERLVRRLLLDHFNTNNSPRKEAIKPRVEEAVRYANEQLYRLAQERYSDMGSTVTLALVVDHRAYIANVGDSRVYIRRDGQLEQITKDHSVVASLIAAGMAQAHEIYTHPERNVVYRSMGNRPTVEIDIWEEYLKSGDQIVLCSDGLWEAIHNEGIEEVLLTYPDAQAATEEMVRRANLAGGEDNITVILAQVG
jgi:serine/threonine protein phosphatase PrpC/ribosomal protein L37E